MSERISPTPTTDQVEDAYAYDPEYEYHRPDDAGYHHRNRAAFRRWLAEHDRQVKLAVLRGFAGSLGVNVGDEDSDYWQGYRNGQRQALRKANDDIDRIEKEQTDD